MIAQVIADDQRLGVRPGHTPARYFYQHLVGRTAGEVHVRHVAETAYAGEVGPGGKCRT